MKNNMLLISTIFLFSNTYLLHGMEQNMYKLIQALEETRKIIQPLVIQLQRPNETCVSIWDSNSITSTPDIKSPLIISTLELGGCLATALHIKYNNGDQYAGITHYPPSSRNDQENIVKMQCLQALKHQTETKKIVATNFFFSAPKEEEKIAISIFHPVMPSRNDLAYKILHCRINIELKKTGIIKTHFIPYDIFESTEERDIELILYPDKATLRIKNNELINL